MEDSHRFRHAHYRVLLARWVRGEVVDEPHALPKAVRAYLPEAPAPAAAPAVGAPLPKSNAGTVTQTPPATTTWTPEAIMRLTPAEYKANAAAIQAAFRTP